MIPNFTESYTLASDELEPEPGPETGPDAIISSSEGKGENIGGNRGNSRETIIVLAVQLCCPHCLCFYVRVIFSVACKYEERESVVPAPPVSNVGSNSQDDEVILLHRGPGWPSTDQ